MSAYTRQKAKSKYSNRIRLERASEKQSSDSHKTPYVRVKRCRERKINIKASERVNVDVFTQNKRPSVSHERTRDDGTSNDTHDIKQSRKLICVQCRTNRYLGNGSARRLPRRRLLRISSWCIVSSGVVVSQHRSLKVAAPCTVGPLRDLPDFYSQEVGTPMGVIRKWAGRAGRLREADWPRRNPPTTGTAVLYFPATPKPACAACCPSLVVYRRFTTARDYRCVEGDLTSLPVTSAARAARLACSPPTPVISHVGIVPDYAAGQWVFSGISRFSRLFIAALLHSRLNLSLVQGPGRYAWERRTALLRARQPANTVKCQSRVGPHPHLALINPALPLVPAPLGG
ncbi:hypothetical protein PR048_026785 [Dryococelus australis]|uniref:Uncharacterized protein n=1 Tax=Dryococelus australis TaxID=614101 RepID=A0ABQ9GMB4_9NEOP|nr:hypothetical protein PR048_026785 [Dryococelus australis]